MTKNLVAVKESYLYIDQNLSNGFGIDDCYPKNKINFLSEILRHLEPPVVQMYAKHIITNMEMI